MTSRDDEIVALLQEIRNELRELNRQHFGEPVPATAPADPSALSIVEVSIALGVHRNTVYSYCKRGHFPNAWKLPGDPTRSEWRIPESDLTSFRRARQPKTYDKKRARKMLANLAR